MKIRLGKYGEGKWIQRPNVGVLFYSVISCVGLHWDFIMIKFTSRCRWVFSVFDQAASMLSSLVRKPNLRKAADALKAALTKNAFEKLYFKSQNECLWLRDDCGNDELPICFLRSWHTCKEHLWESYSSLRIISS